MAKEIERKFLIDSSKINFKNLSSFKIKQGYIAKTSNKTVVRVRTVETLTVKNGFLTIKGKNNGSIRDEFEYLIPYEDAVEMLNKFCNKIIDKERFILIDDKNKNHKWEIDVFGGSNTGLIIAEIELNNIEDKIFLPDWILQEVTNDSKYYNSNLLEKEN